LVNLVSGHLVGKPTSLPKHWQLSQGYLVGPDANLVGANLANARLRDADLDGANLGAVTAPCIGTICAQYEGLIIAVLSNANLSDANLTDANLSAADLAGADLAGAKVTGANLSDIAASTPRSFVFPWVGVTNLADVRSGSIVGVPADLPTGWQLIGGYLVGPGVDLADAQLEGANFTTTASLAPLEWAWPNDLPASDVPTDFTLISGHVIGPGTDFASAMLTDSDFMDVDLVGSNLTNADLSGANMTGVETDDTTTCPNGAAGPCTF
jgi:uncharacterized protein YjbI with pentapeptide repeats